MTEHVTAWLGAYHDGELQGRRLRQIEVHLTQCETCRAELDALRTLTELLQESPIPEGITSPERFVAQVGLRLPRRQVEPIWKRTLEIGWRLVPVGLLGAWAFVQAVLFASGTVLRALQLGLGSDVAAWLLPASRQGPWWAQALGISGASIGDIGQTALQFLSNGGPLGWFFTLNLVSLFVIGLLYWSWLASWWARRRHVRTRIPEHQRIG
ncbi:MAG: zf-HC2 domain-containing protein [Chloroflexota bacterium]|nr:zf-HC2 domain-containing protein [Chloroflexota bacterium]